MAKNRERPARAEPSPGAIYLRKNGGSDRQGQVLAKRPSSR